VKKVQFIFLVNVHVTTGLFGPSRGI